jgi:hypothetical protein
MRDALQDNCHRSEKNETRLHHRRAELAQWRVKMRRSAFWCVLVKLISETCPLLQQKGDVHFYCASPITQVKGDA